MSARVQARHNVGSSKGKGGDPDMEYQDNYVTLDLQSSQYSFGTVTFTVGDLSITSGQDPNHINQVGEKPPFTPVSGTPNEGQFLFVVGRSGSAQVADFFNQNYNSTENTFDHSAGDLNFAFKGTLSIGLVPQGSGSPATLVFPGACLAQGHSGTSNNWWFAVTGANNIGNDTISVKDKNKGWTVNFLRGGNDDSTVSMTIVSQK